MQQIKDTKTIEFQKFLDDDDKKGLCLEDTLWFSDIRRIFGHFDAIKQRVIGVTLNKGDSFPRGIIPHQIHKAHRHGKNVRDFIPLLF